jgi:hypothetical protein
VGAASSREKKSLYSHLHNRGWKPLPQSTSFKLKNLNSKGSNEVSFLIKLAAIQARRNAEP